MAETLGAIFFSGSEERAQSSLVPPLFLRHSPPLRWTLRTTPRSLPNHEGYYSFKNMVMNIKYILRGRIFLTCERSMPPPMSQSNEPLAMERRWGFNSM